MEFAAGLLVGLLVGGTAGVSFALPAVGRAVGRFLAVLLVGLGAGTLVWALAVGSSGELLRWPFGSDVIRYRSEAFGWAGGLLVGGVLAGVAAFWPRGNRPDRAAV